MITETGSDELLDIFEIPPNMRTAIKDSWRKRQSDLLGRFDFSWDGRGHPKLMEYNADTPTILVETDVGQKLWLQMMRKETNASISQFNTISTALIEAWPKIVPKGKTIEFLNISNEAAAVVVEEREHIEYLKSTALKADRQVKSIFDLPPPEEPLTHSDDRAETGDDKKVIEPHVKYVWKGRPYEWLAYENSAVYLFSDVYNCDYRFIEPPWKLILANKAILALLWQMYPDHPNLLFSTYDKEHEFISPTLAGKMNRAMVAKPKYGREGQGVIYSNHYGDAAQFVQEAQESTLIRDPSVSTSDSDFVYLGEPGVFAAHVYLYLQTIIIPFQCSISTVSPHWSLQQS